MNYKLIVTLIPQIMGSLANKTGTKLIKKWKETLKNQKYLPLKVQCLLPSQSKIIDYFHTYHTFSRIVPQTKNINFLNNIICPFVLELQSA